MKAMKKDIQNSKRGIKKFCKFSLFPFIVVN